MVFVAFRSISEVLKISTRLLDVPSCVVVTLTSQCVQKSDQVSPFLVRVNEKEMFFVMKDHVG